MKKKKNISEENQKNREAMGKIPMVFLKTVLKCMMAVFNVILTVCLVGAIAAAIVVCAFLVYIANNVDSSVDDVLLITQNNELATRLYYYDANGELVENTDDNISSGTGATWVNYEDIPTYLRDAFIAIEDKRFWDHNGVDWIATTRAAVTFFVPIGSDRGGSTLTQQLIKNLTGNDDYSIQRKIQEIFKAINLEKELGGDKTVIIEQYCNIVYFSQGAYGVQAAARTYFGKDAKDLTLVECASLASIVQNPARWDPRAYPENNTERRRIILKEMLSQGLITRAEYDEAYNTELVLRSRSDENIEDTPSDSKNSSFTSWYTDEVIEESIRLLMEKYEVPYAIAEKMLFNSGYQIITAMDYEIQRIIEKYYEKTPSDYFNNSEVLNHESAFVVIDHKTGQIKGLVGGRGEKTGSRLFNRATQSTRSPGSSMKPIGAYALALERGIISYGSVLDDGPHIITGNSGWPRNANNKYGGLVTIEYALAYSKNTFPVKLVASLGVEASYNFLSKSLGITTLAGNADKNLSALAIGGMTNGVKLSEITAAYAVFPSGGVYTKPTTVLSILDSDGNVIIDNVPQKNVAISEDTAQSMVRLMRAVATYGTGYGYLNKTKNMGLQVAGKTGTTDNNFDKWFIGYSPYYTAGVWIGYDQNQSLGGTHGHITMWDAIMTEIHRTKITSKGQKLVGFDLSMLISAKFCKDSGGIMTDICKQDPRGNRENTGYYTKDTLPTEECKVHVKVQICSSCNKAITEYCPESSIVTKVLLKIDRSYLPEEFKPMPTDTAYVYDPSVTCVCHLPVVEPEIPETPENPEIPEIPELPEVPVTPEPGTGDDEDDTDPPDTTE